MPIVIELMVLCLLSACWLASHWQVARPLDASVYHVAVEKRDSRKAKFYFASVWVGLVSAFFCARSLEALSSLTFDSSSQRAWVLGSLRGVEMWGLLIVGAVWSRVGQRVSRPNSDGASPLLANAPSSTPKYRNDSSVR